jgi:hypothetical protein
VFLSAVQEDNKVVAVGYTSGEMLIARFNDDGTPDAGFGTAGRVFTEVGEAPWAVKLQGDQILVAAGMTLTRLNVDGTLDKDFGQDGITEYGFGEAPGVPAELVIQGDKIVIGVACPPISNP